MTAIKRPNPNPGKEDALIQSADLLASEALAAKTVFHPKARLLTTAAPAGVIAYSLFIFMGWLIAAEFEPATIVETREIVSITPEERSEDVRAKSRVKPKRLASATKPPPPPKLSATKQDVSLPTPTISGAPPSDVIFERVPAPEFGPVAITDRDALPIRPPVVTYPTRAQERGLEGECTVTFNVDVRGQPYDVTADCSDGVFRREAIRAVNKVQFAPKVVKGRAQERRNVVYPLVFTLES